MLPAGGQVLTSQSSLQGDTITLYYGGRPGHLPASLLMETWLLGPCTLSALHCPQGAGVAWDAASRGALAGHAGKWTGAPAAGV